MTYTHEDFKYIDMHTHFFPPKIFEAIWSFFEFPDKRGEPVGWNINYKLSPEELVRFLENKNVKFFTTFNYAHKAGIAEYINEWTYKFAKKYNNALAFGSVSPDDKNRIEYISKIFDEYNFYGIKIQLLVQEFYPYDERMTEVYKLIVDRGKWINFHAGTAPYRNRFVGYKHFLKFLKKFPDMKIIVAHLGAYEHEKFFKLLDKYENLYLDTTMVYVPLELFKKWKRVFNQPKAEELLSYQNRLFYGSDFPNIPYDYIISTQGLLNLDLPRDFYQDIFYNNAKKVFNLSK